MSLLAHIPLLPARYAKQTNGAKVVSSDSVLQSEEVDIICHELYPQSREPESCLQLHGLDGSLEILTSMPVDILYEIFAHLHPKDILSLSRASKSLHAFLTNEGHARGIWRSSLAAVRALPPCPTDMTERQYASLVFDDWCHFCLAPGVHDIAWLCRVRCCTKCIQEQFMSEDELGLCLPEDIYIDKPETIFPFFAPQKRAVGRNKPIYYRPSVREYLRQLDCQTGDAALAVWSQQKKDKQALRMEHASRCEYWHAHWGFRPSHQLFDSYIWELLLVIWLCTLLFVLWKDIIF